MRRRGSTIAVLVFGLALAGCSGGPTAGPSPSHTRHATIPQGYTRTTAGPLSFAHPPGWHPGKAPAGASVVLQRARHGVVYAQATVLTKVPQVGDPEIVGQDAYAAVPVTAADANRGPFRPLTVPGAKKAVRLDYTFKSTRNDAAARGTDISVVYDGDKALVLRISGLRTALSDATVEQIVRSMEVRG